MKLNIEIELGDAPTLDAVSDLFAQIIAFRKAAGLETAAGQPEWSHADPTPGLIVGNKQIDLKMRLAPKTEEAAAL